MTTSRKTKCCICKIEDIYLLPLVLLKNEVYELIKLNHSHIEKKDFICFKDMDYYKLANIKKMLPEIEHSEPTDIDSFQHWPVSKDLNHTYHARRTFGEKLADQVAAFGGSWSFIISFALFIMGWIIINSHKILTSPLDPFPYILLNLILSCLAALQAPIIMMSQNRQETKDRLRATHDYEINLKAELEIRMLNTKLDHYIQVSWEHLKKIEEQQLTLKEKN